MGSRRVLLVVSGGLGPTDDDLTREALADLIGGELVRRDDLLETLEEWFAGRKFPMKESNKRQAEVPVGAESVPNPVGTAPGLSAEHDGCRIVVTPGLPKRLLAPRPRPSPAHPATGRSAARRSIRYRLARAAAHPRARHV